MPLYDLVVHIMSPPPPSTLAAPPAAHPNPPAAPNINKTVFVVVDILPVIVVFVVRDGIFFLQKAQNLLFLHLP